MKKNLFAMLFATLLIGTIAVGCGESEDFTATDTEFAKMNEATLAAHTSAMAGFGEMMTAMSSMTVADDWDDSHKAAFEAAQKKMSDYKAKFDDGAATIASLATDLEAAKEEGSKAYDAKLAEAKKWHTEYNTWLGECNKEAEAFKASAATEGGEPFWYTSYQMMMQEEGMGDEMSDDAAASGDDATADGGEDAASSDVEGLVDKAKNIEAKVTETVDNAKDAVEDVKDKAKDIKEAAGGILNSNDGE